MAWTTPLLGRIALEKIMEEGGRAMNQGRGLLARHLSIQSGSTCSEARST